MCRSSATADLIGEIRSNHSSDLLPKADLRFDGTQAMQFNACEFGAQFGDETEAPPSS